MNIQFPIGNKAVLELLKKLANGKKVPHAYVFFGPEGIGKKLFALHFAKILNCTSKDIKPCNNCINCQKINKNIHSDIKIIETDKKQIKIDEIRSAINFANSSAIEGKYKFIIIDDAHKMNQFSANALLKTLEEPISNTIIILITENDKSLLRTILSRCVKISFAPLSSEDITKILLEKGYDKEKILNIVDYSSGSVKTAEELLKEKNYELFNDTIETLKNIKNIRFLEISSLSEKISLNNFEEIAFNIITQFFYKKITNIEKDFIFALSSYEKVVNFKRFLRYNIAKSFILEALFLSISIREEI